jgi:hypothetical protein
MTTPASSEGGTGTEEQLVITGLVLGQGLWCRHLLVYLSPGSPPGDCEVDFSELYEPANVYRSFALVDFPLDYGQWCPTAPPHPLGQYSIHQLVRNMEQP